MRRGIVRSLLAAAILAAYPVASLYPFHPLRWEFPRRVVNGAEVLPQGGIRFPRPGIARSSAPPAWVTAAARSHRLKLSLRVRSFAPDQEGPARILTLSTGPYRRNLTIGQEGEDLVLRLRTPRTDLNGTPDDGGPFADVPGVFGTPAWADLHMRIEPGRLRVEVGGETRVDQDLPPEPLRNWSPSYRLALGNELTNDRPWLGEIRHAVVRTPGHGAVDYAEPGALEVPPRFWHTTHSFRLVPFREVEPRDAVLNLVGYVPLGFLVGVWARGRRRFWRVAGPVAVAFAMSAGMEALQFAVPVRFPSTTDLILNTLGGGIGGLLALAGNPAVSRMTGPR